MQTRWTYWLSGCALLALAAAPAALAADDPPEAITPAAKTVLFTGNDFRGWVKFAPGEDADPDTIWTVRDGVIHCLGKPNGYIRTDKRYRDYRLHLEWRWPDEPTNSGVLLHTELPDQVWPKTVEAQLMHEKAGDFWMLSFSTIQDKDGNTIGPKQFANLPKREPSSEKAPGEWNAYDIVCDGGTVRLTVNGVLQNEGFQASPAEGYICLQSEGSPIQFRNLYLEPLAR